MVMQAVPTIIENPTDESHSNSGDGATSNQPVEQSRTNTQNNPTTLLNPEWLALSNILEQTEQQLEQARARVQEVAKLGAREERNTRYRIVQPNLDRLSSLENELDWAYLEPFLGPEVTRFINELLADPNDEVFLTGSSVTKILVGGYMIDAQTGTVPPDTRSDLDIYAKGHVVNRASNTQVESAETHFSTQVEAGDTKLDVVSLERIAVANITALQELLTWHQSDQRVPILEKQAKQILADLQDEPTPETIMRYNASFPHEALSIRLRKTSDGDLQAEIVDPHGLVVPKDEQDPYDRKKNFAEQIQVSRFFNNGDPIQSVEPAFHGVSVFGGETCTKGVLLHTIANVPEEVLQDLDKPPFSNKQVLYTANLIPRAIVSASDDVGLLAGVPVMSTYEEDKRFADDLYELSVRLSSDPRLLNELSGFAEIPDAAEWFETKLQMAFARASVNNTTSAIQWMTTSLRLGSFLSDEVDEVTAPYHERVPPDFGLTVSDKISEFLRIMRRDPDTVLTPYGESLKYLALIGHFEGLAFGTTQVSCVKAGTPLNQQMEQEQYRESLDDEIPLIYHDTSVAPKNMSQIFAVMFAAMSLDPEKQTDREIIEKTVEGWDRTETIDFFWKRTRNQEFSCRATVEETLDFMKELIARDEARKNVIRLEFAKNHLEKQLQMTPAI